VFYGRGAFAVLRHSELFNEIAIRDAFAGYQQSCGGQLFCGIDTPAYTPVVEVPGVTAGLEDGRERRAASRKGSRLDSLGGLIMRWAQAAPADPLVPEALHHLVRRTRRASMHYRTTGKTGALSKSAFQLLHRRYEDTEWAAKTRYWYR
jgi:hypothetical protein